MGCFSAGARLVYSGGAIFAENKEGDKVAGELKGDQIAGESQSLMVFPKISDN